MKICSVFHTAFFMCLNIATGLIHETFIHTQAALWGTVGAGDEHRVTACDFALCAAQVQAALFAQTMTCAVIRHCPA